MVTGTESTLIRAARTNSTSDKQAVIVIHGMGEQRPMDTLRSFVRTMWELNPEIARGDKIDRAEVWSRLDGRTGSLELRRITTRASKPGGTYQRGARTDFYELYWADLTAGSTWEQFTGWIRYLLFRRWENVPDDVRSAWIALWGLTLLLIAIGVIAGLPEAMWPEWAPRWPLVAIVGLGGAWLSRIATQTFGRVVRYTRADPDNIAARAAVRDRGLKLLEALHQDDSYARIVVVGHSLGTIVAYDLVNYFWARNDGMRSTRIDEPAFDALRRCEEAAAALEANPSDGGLAATFRLAQAGLRRALGEEARGAAARWRISDLVTIGSPLTHAEFLLGSGLDDLARRKVERELPTAPPYRERLDEGVLELAQKANLILPEDEDPRLFSFPNAGASDRWQMHQGAAFAAVRWSNVYDPSRHIYRGDMISGELGSIFGAGVEDVDLSQVRGQADYFSHMRYWSEKAPEEQLVKLRAVLNLLDA